MTEIATIDWFWRWGTSVFSENTAIFLMSSSFSQKIGIQMILRLSGCLSATNIYVNTLMQHSDQVSF